MFAIQTLETTSVLGRRKQFERVLGDDLNLILYHEGIMILIDDEITFTHDTTTELKQRDWERQKKGKEIKLVIK